MRSIFLSLLITIFSSSAFAERIEPESFFNGMGFDIGDILNINISADDKMAEKIANKLFEEGKKEGGLNGANKIRKSFFLATLITTKVSESGDCDDIIFSIGKFCDWKIAEVISSQYTALSRLYPYLQEMKKIKAKAKTRDERRESDSKQDFSGKFTHISGELDGHLILRRINQKWDYNNGFMYGYEWSTGENRICSGQGYFIDNLFSTTGKCYLKIAVINNQVRVFPSGPTIEKMQFEGIWDGERE